MRNAAAELTMENKKYNAPLNRGMGFNIVLHAFKSIQKSRTALRH
jgi:hypothetical protein